MKFFSFLFYSKINFKKEKKINYFLIYFFFRMDQKKKFYFFNLYFFRTDKKFQTLFINFYFSWATFLSFFLYDKKNFFVDL